MTWLCRTVLAPLLAALVLSLPASASAARPFNLGAGNQPGIAVGSSGEAHVAWKRELGGRDVLEYCRVEKRTRRCSLRRTLQLGDRTTTGDAIVLAPSPGVVHILVGAGGSERGALFTSTNGGETFAGPYALGELAGIRAAAMAPAGGFTVMTDFFGVNVARFGLDGSGPAGEPAAELGTARERALGVLGNMPVALFVEDFRLRTYRGLGADLNNPAGWVEGPGIRRVDTVEAAGGRRGLWVAYTHRRSFHRDVKIRRLRAGGWGRVRPINRGDDPLWINLAQGRSGLVVAWATSTATRVRYRTSRTGRRWSRVRTLFRGHNPTELRMALGRRGGWMVWDGDELNAGTDTIRIAPVPRPR